MQPGSNAAERQFDIVVIGASGFTGQLVVEYLAQHYTYDGPVRWAIAGRNRQKLDDVIAAHFPSGLGPPVLLADSNDAASLKRLALSTRVVLTTVGPYARFGSELVAACVACGTHYCDLAGETQWMRRMLDCHQQEAQSSGARIVHSCGFDSIPSDLGVYYLQQQAKAKFGAPCTRIDLLVRAMKGGASGGTIASMLNAIDEARTDRSTARILADPYGLNPEGERSGLDEPDQRGIRLNMDTGLWTAPFVMAAVNTRIVRRSNALQNYPYGRDFRYSEATATGRGPGGWWKAVAMTGGLACFMLACSFEFTRTRVMKKLLPEPGDGPSRQQRERGFFDLRLIGQTKSGDILQARVTGDRDPGYGSTSKMLSESAVCLSLDKLEVGGGFWTPASAMGDALLRRMTANAGLTFELVP